MQLIQIIIIVFALFAYSRAILRFKDKKISISELALWTVVWVSVILAGINTGSISWLSDALGIKRPVDLALYSSVILLFYLTFRIYVKLESLEQDITKVVRNIAIKKTKKKK